MRVLSQSEMAYCHGGLTEKQEDSLLGKVGSYGAHTLMLAGLYGLGFVNLHVLVVGGVLGPVCKIAGTYLVYENKDWIKETLGDYYPL